MITQRDHELVALIAGHFDLDVSKDSERLEDIRELVGKINAAGLGPSSIRGLINTEEIRKILGLGSVRSTWVTMSRDGAFPEPVVTERLWRASEIRKYALKRANNRAGMPGRPPNSAASKAI